MFGSREKKRRDQTEIQTTSETSTPQAQTPSGTASHQISKISVVGEPQGRAVAAEAGYEGAKAILAENEELGGITDLLTSGWESRGEAEDAAHEMKNIRGKSVVDKTQTAAKVASLGATATEKGATAVADYGNVAESTAGSLGAAAEVAGQAVGGLGAVTGAIDMGKGADQFRKASRNKKGLRGKLAHNDAELAVNSWLGGGTKSGPEDAFLHRSGEEWDQREDGFATRTDGGGRMDVMNERFAQKHLIEQQNKAQKDGAFKTVTGALDVASGVATATGAGAAAGATIGLVSTGAKVGKKAVEYGVQKGRNSKAAGRQDLLAKQALGSMAENAGLEDAVGGLSTNEEKKLSTQSKQKARHNKALRGQKLGYMEGAREATSLNTAGSAENQAADKANTAELIMKSSGATQLEYLATMGITEAMWGKMQAKAEKAEDPQKELKDLLIAGQVSF